jgi:transposase
VRHSECAAAAITTVTRTGGGLIRSVNGYERGRWLCTGPVAVAAGALTLSASLKAEGESVGRYKAGRLMAEAGLRSTQLRTHRYPTGGSEASVACHRSRNNPPVRVIQFSPPSALTGGSDISSYEVNSAMLSDQRKPLEVEMIGQERWAEIRRLHDEEGQSISAIARLLDLDRKTVRRCIRDAQWHPYRRAMQMDTLLSPHDAWLRQRAPEVRYSARILYQELKARQGYVGSYETVKRFVAPLRELSSSDALTQTRFETAPGQQSQVDWGEARVTFRHGATRLRIFVLTLGFSRRGFYWAYPDERLNQFLEAHERAFAHFGGLTAEHLYDRPRTVCYQNREGRVVWNTTFKAFAEHWGFEPRVCRAYRAQAKGKVESGVKYVKRNFLPGRSFIDIVDFTEQLTEWNASIADTRVHGTTHEVPLRRFDRERAHLLPAHR